MMGDPTSFEIIRRFPRVLYLNFRTTVADNGLFVCAEDISQMFRQNTAYALTEFRVMHDFTDDDLVTGLLKTSFRPELLINGASFFQPPAIKAGFENLGSELPLVQYVFTSNEREDGTIVPINSVTLRNVGGVIKTPSGEDVPARARLAFRFAPN
jgi:hypothetical protein